MTPCIEWPKARSGSGYGQTCRKGKVIYAHRAAYEDAYGPIPPGLFVMHRCDNPPCVNPEHLTLGSVTDNNRDMWAKGRGRIPHYRGAANPAARLTPEQVAAIRSDDRILRLIAADYGIHISTVHRIRRGATWA